MKVNQFAPVANLETYRRLPLDVLGEYQLLIATEVVKDLDAWGDFWVGAVVTEQFIIMDNGLIESGTSADVGVIGAAAEAVQASCIVLPDTLGDFEATLAASGKAMETYREVGLPLMGVIQGRTVEEVETIIDFYIGNDVEYLSIPRVMVEIFKTRRWLVERVRWRGKPIHLLGWSENVADDLACAAMEGVVGIDSAVPLWLPHYFGPVPTSQTVYGKRPSDFWDAIPDQDDLDRMETNIRWTRGWIKLLGARHG
jgi:hypothetical protein